MSKRITLSAEQEQWLADHHSDFTHKELAAELDCCVDTLKRILMRRGLQYFDGAKYQFKSPPPTWKRPCSWCGCTKKRPKYQYRCDTCHEREASDPDFFELSSYALISPALRNRFRRYTHSQGGIAYGQSAESQGR